MSIGIGIIVLLVLIVFCQYNTLVKLKMKVKQAKSGIDVYCQQRFDLIPNLIETVKGYMKHEKEVFENITKLRTEYNNTKDIKVSQELNKQMNSIIAVAENYPNLKASEQFLNLQRNLEKIESQLQAARRIYNNDVTNYNTKISIVPYNIIASIFNFESESLFELEDENARENIKVEL
jgi:LemA protein